MEEGEQIRRLEVRQLQLSVAMRTIENEVRRASGEVRNQERAYKRSQNTYKKIVRKMRDLKSSLGVVEGRVMSPHEMGFRHKRQAAMLQQIQSAGKQLVQAGEVLSNRKDALLCYQSRLKTLTNKGSSISDTQFRKRAQIKARYEGEQLDEQQSLVAYQLKRMLFATFKAGRNEPGNVSATLELNKVVHEDEKDLSSTGASFIDISERFELPGSESAGSGQLSNCADQFFNSQEHSSPGNPSQHSSPGNPSQHPEPGAVQSLAGGGGEPIAAGNISSEIARRVSDWMESNSPHTVDLLFSAKTGEAFNMRLGRDGYGRLEVVVSAQTERSNFNLKKSRRSIVQELESAGYQVRSLVIGKVPDGASQAEESV